MFTKIFVFLGARRIELFAGIAIYFSLSIFGDFASTVMVLNTAGNLLRK